jgi:putative SOS response-associated peptidase YedK
MCGRLAPHVLEYLAAKYRLCTSPLLQELRAVGRNINTTPNSILPGIFQESAQPRDWLVRPVYWQFLPQGIRNQEEARQFSRTYSTINARQESIHTQPLYADAFRKQRCVIPIRGFFEWQPIQGEPRKRPWWVAPKKEIVGIAALYNTTLWKPEVPTVAVVTTHSSPGKMAAIHERMPAFLTAQEAELWLNPTTPETHLLVNLNTKPEECFEFIPVSRVISNARWMGTLEELLALPMEEKSTSKKENPPESIQGDLFS